MSDVRITICGRLAVEAGPAVVLERDFPARQGRRLWAFLVLRRRWPVARADLAEAVWGDDIPDAWDAALSALASRLRAALRPILTVAPEIELRGEVGRYELRLSPDAFIDAERARAGLHTAETALRRGDLDLALSEARVAMEIAARGFLSGEPGDWIEGERRTLREIRMHALETTVEAELRRGNPAMAEREAEQCIALEPLRESGYRLRMRALAAMGDAGAAARVMDDCRRALRDSAGLVPSAETERVYRDLTARS